MPEVAAFKYRAFLSYSHHDKAWAKWLHRALEGCRIDKDLVGRDTVHGPVPKTLRPIFRDRDDFSAGHSLTEQTLAVLEASQFLIVICSRNGAQSQYVNEEVRRFKALGRGSCVIPVVVDGEPGDPQCECFPSALRFKVATGGRLTDEHEEPIAADARPQKDGKEIAKQKVVAGLLGVGLDEILRRAKRARKRRNLISFGAACAAALVVVIAAVGWTAGLSVSSRLVSERNMHYEREAADLCEQAGDVVAMYRFSEEDRMSLAFECVSTLSLAFNELSASKALSPRFISIFEQNIAVLQKFDDAGQLSPEQSEVLGKAEKIAAQLSHD